MTDESIVQTRLTMACVRRGQLYVGVEKSLNIERNDAQIPTFQINYSPNCRTIGAERIQIFHESVSAEDKC